MVMKKQMVQSLLMVGLGGLMVTGCYSHRVVVREQPALAPTGELIVTEAPPALRHEVIGVAPGAESVWISGYWTHTHNRWVWLPGHWEARPRAGATWAPGYWQHTTSGWVWRSGHWD